MRRSSSTPQPEADRDLARGAAGWARVTLAGLGVVGLAACASAPTPAPIHRPSVITAPVQRPVLPSTDFSGLPSPDLQQQPAIDSSGPPLQCVPYARRISGIDIFGDAVTWWGQAYGRYPRSSTPAAGSVLVLRGYQDDARGHVAVVSRLVSDRMMLVDHANWMRRGEISTAVPVADVSPGNDWSQVRIWHVPGGHWGGRVYEAEGFVHPIGLSMASGS